MRTTHINTPQLIRRLTLRETRSSRAALSIMVAAVLLLAAIWLGLELLLSRTGNAALLISPAELAQKAASLATATIPGVLVAAGALVTLVGIALLCAAVLAGTKPRHIIANPRAAVVVDSEVVAAAVSRTARTAAHLAPEQVASSVGRKRIDVSVRPAAGRSVDVDTVREAVEKEVATYGLLRQPAITISAGNQPSAGKQRAVSA